MGVFAIWIELANDAPVQGPHEADASKHRRAAVFDNQEQRFDRGLPLRDLLFGLRQLLDIFGSILEGDEMAAARQRDRVIERALSNLSLPSGKQVRACLGERHITLPTTIAMPRPILLICATDALGSGRPNKKAVRRRSA
jgi:hypothetical protein